MPDEVIPSPLGKGDRACTVDEVMLSKACGGSKRQRADLCLVCHRIRFDSLLPHPS